MILSLNRWNGLGDVVCFLISPRINSWAIKCKRNHINGSIHFRLFFIWSFCQSKTHNNSAISGVSYRLELELVDDFEPLFCKVIKTFLLIYNSRIQKIKINELYPLSWTAPLRFGSLCFGYTFYRFCFFTAKCCLHLFPSLVNNVRPYQNTMHTLAISGSFAHKLFTL